MTSPLIKSVRGLRSLERAWHVIRENARTSKSNDVQKEVERFEEDASRNLRSLSARLSHGSFKFPPAKGVPISKDKPGGPKTGKFRPIVIADVESRIVQRSILDVLLFVPALQPYAQNAYSFGGIRKTEDSLGAVPAAINAVLKAIEGGAKFVAVGDISSFFTRISKEAVTKIVRDATGDDEFTEFFKKAITVELANMAELREKAQKFPTHDIGVAQGNSLSPLLGNIILHEFDRQMNEGDCRCLRYIDDIIILAPGKKAAEAKMLLAVKILSKLGMELSAEKSFIKPIPVSECFDYLGIELNNGFIRPASSAKAKLLAKVQGELDASVAAFKALDHGQPLPKVRSLISTLKRVDGIVQGWGKHYRFCNDGQCFANLDDQLADMIRKYLGIYSDSRKRAGRSKARTLFGLEQLSLIERAPFQWPKAK